MNKTKPKVIGMECVGGAYKNGFYHSGWGVAILSNGTRIITPEKDAYPDGILNYVKDRADTSEYKKKLDNWVKTGELK